MNFTPADWTGTLRAVQHAGVPPRHRDRPPRPTDHHVPLAYEGLSRYLVIGRVELSSVDRRDVVWVTSHNPDKFLEALSVNRLAQVDDAQIAQKDRDPRAVGDKDGQDAAPPVVGIAMQCRMPFRIGPSRAALEVRRAEGKCDYTVTFQASIDGTDNALARPDLRLIEPHGERPAVAMADEITLHLEGAVGTIRADRVWEAGDQYCYDSKGYQRCLAKRHVSAITPPLPRRSLPAAPPTLPPGFPDPATAPRNKNGKPMIPVYNGDPMTPGTRMIWADPDEPCPPKFQ